MDSGVGPCLLVVLVVLVVVFVVVLLITLVVIVAPILFTLVIVPAAFLLVVLLLVLLLVVLGFPLLLCAGRTARMAAVRGAGRRLSLQGAILIHLRQEGCHRLRGRKLRLAPNPENFTEMRQL